MRRPKGTTAMHKWAVVRQHVSGKHLVQLLAFEAASSELALSSALGHGSAAVAAEVPELEARRGEHLDYAQPRVTAATEAPQGPRGYLWNNCKRLGAGGDNQSGHTDCAPVRVFRRVKNERQSTAALARRTD